MITDKELAERLRTLATMMTIVNVVAHNLDDARRIATEAGDDLLRLAEAVEEREAQREKSFKIVERRMAGEDGYLPLGSLEEHRRPADVEAMLLQGIGPGDWEG